VCLAAFWTWWLQPDHRVAWIGLVVNSAVLLYLSFSSVYFVVAVNRLRQVDSAVAVPRLRVAFVVTRARSEPWDMARSTLTAMLAQNLPLPYDVWLCDEEPFEEIRRWCTEHGIRVSTRKGAEDYHRKTWPRRRKCKEGNLAYFYDRWGYQHYDVVAQLDCDHVPSRTYLAELIRPFSDPAVGYVAAPSVCDANAALSWAARGRLHQQAAFHGPVQLGLNAGLAPVCIGSHYAVRTQALREIGGIGPELAEDFSTTYLLNAAGWHGAFAIGAEAHGHGPPTFKAMLIQEFQWARSMTTILFGLVPCHLGRLPWRLRLRFLYQIFHYVVLATVTIVGFALPPIAAVAGFRWVDVNYLEFLFLWLSIAVWLKLITLLLRDRGLLRPPNSPILSWETWLYSLTRWPAVTWGVCAATLRRMRPREITFKVTPKDINRLEPLSVRLILPYVAISVVLAVAAIVGEFFNNSAGYIFLCLLGATIYAIVALMIPVLHAVEAARTAAISLRAALRSTLRIPLVIPAVPLLPLMAAIIWYPSYPVHLFG
jgi:cellulose synthase/poly-beta-1,6-N-acetylglucosamine synthase-like glycosyltransferase